MASLRRRRSAILQVALEVRSTPVRIAACAMGRAAGIHPQGPGGRLVARRCISTEGARQTSRQAAGAVDVEARVARLVQDALAATVLAGGRAIPVVTTVVAVVVAPSGARRRSGPEGQVPIPAAVRRRLADQGLVFSREFPAKKRKEFPHDRSR